MKTILFILAMALSSQAFSNDDDDARRRSEKLEYDLRHAGDSMRETMDRIKDDQRAYEQEKFEQEASDFFERDRKDHLYGKF